MASILDYLKTHLPSVGGSSSTPSFSSEANARGKEAVEKGKAIVKGAGMTLNELFPGVGQIAHGVKTGDWEPYKQGFKANAIGPIVERDPVTGEMVQNKENMEKITNITLGFVNPTFGPAKGGKQLVESFAEKAAKLKNAEDISKAAAETWGTKITQEEAEMVGKRYASEVDPKKIAQDLEAMGNQASRSASGQGAPGEAAGRRGTPTPSAETPTIRRPEKPLPSATPDVPNVSSSPLYSALFEDATTMGKKLRKALLNTVEYVQDSGYRVKKLQEVPGTVVDDASDIYQKQTLTPGRIQARVDDAKDVAKEVFGMLEKTARGVGSKPEALRKDVQDYLVARHAPERNAALGDKAAGMTNEEAAARIAALESSPQAAIVKEAAEKLQELHNRTLAALREGGVISDELYSGLREKYPNHVPLQRVFEDDDFAGALAAKGFDVKSTGIKRAKGSDREVDDVASNILYNYEQAVLRSEKNIADQAVLNFVRNNPQFSDIFKIRKPKALGKDFEGKPIMEKTDDPNVLQMFENGEKVWVEIADDNLAIALRGVNREKLGPFLNTIGAFTRFYSGLMTRFNPEFFAPNKLRDLQEAMVYAASQKGMGAKGAVKTAASDPGSIRDVTQGLMGMDTPGAKLYREMKEAGGTTGGMGLSTKKDVKLNVEDIIETAKSKPKRAIRMLLEGTDNLNQIFEDSTRLSIYKSALERGLSKDRAAFLAKEGTINFNRMGKGGPVVNALYMFSNASIQGSTKMMRAMRNPKVAASVIATVGGSVAAVNAYNDQMDPEWRDKVAKWDRLNGLTVMLPADESGKVRYLTIPVSWGLKPIKVMSDFAADAAYGQNVDAGDFAQDLFTSIAEAYNPAGGTDPVSGLTPTILDIPVEIARNQKWSGSKIRPDYDKNAPASTQYFPSLRDTSTGRFFADATKQIARMGVEVSPADLNYGFEQYIGGLGRFAKKTGNSALGLVPGNDPVPLSEYPLISRFYRSRDADESTGTTGKGDKIKDLEKEASRESFYRKEKAADTIKELDAMKGDNEGRKARLKQIAAEDPELAKKIIADLKARAAGLTDDEKKLKSATVNSRATLILEEIEGKPDAEAKAILKNYDEKGILTANVLKRLEELRKE